MNGIQVTKPLVWHWKRPLDTVVKNIEYKKITIDHAMYVKIFSNGMVSYLTMSRGVVLNTRNNDVTFQ